MIRNPSLRRRLLLFVSIPLLAVLVCGGIINYVIGLHYANKVYDRWLLDSAEAIGDLVNSDAGRNELSDQARILLQFSIKERNEFAVRSLRYGVLAGNDDLPQPIPAASQGSPVFTNFLDRGQPMRMASVFLANKADPGDVLVISTAETVNKRGALARELLVSTVPIELLLIGVAMALVCWASTAACACSIRWRTRSGCAKPATCHRCAPSTRRWKCNRWSRPSTHCWAGSTGCCASSSASSPTPRINCVRRWPACACRRNARWPIRAPKPSAKRWRTSSACPQVRRARPGNCWRWRGRKRPMNRSAPPRRWRWPSWCATKSPRVFPTRWPRASTSAIAARSTASP